MRFADDGTDLQVLELGFFQIGQVLLHDGELDLTPGYFLRQLLILNGSHFNHMNLARDLVAQFNQRAAVRRLFGKSYGFSRQLCRLGNQSSLDIDLGHLIGGPGS